MENRKEPGLVKIRRTLLELAENHLESPETSHFISQAGVDKLRKKLAS